MTKYNVKMNEYMILEQSDKVVKCQWCKVNDSSVTIMKKMWIKHPLILLLSDIQGSIFASCSYLYPLMSSPRYLKISWSLFLLYRSAVLLLHILASITNGCPPSHFNCFSCLQYLIFLWSSSSSSCFVAFTWSLLLLMASTTWRWSYLSLLRNWSNGNFTLSCISRRSLGWSFSICSSRPQKISGTGLSVSFLWM